MTRSWVREPVPKFWLASALNSGSTWVMQVSIFLFVLRHSSPAELAMVQLAGTLPSLLLMPFAGTLADRVSPRWLALGSMLAQTAALAAMAVSLDIGLVWLAALYGLQGTANAVWLPSRQRWVYGVVPATGRVTANAALSSVSGAMAIIGSIAGGALSAWSTRLGLFTAGIVQLLAVLPLALLPEGPTGSPASTAGTFWADLRQGVVALRALPLARSVVWIGIAWGLIGGGYTVLIASYAASVIHGGGATLGAFYVTYGVGTLIGVALAARLPIRRHLPAYALAYVVQGVSWAVMFLTTGVGTAGVMLGATGISGGVIVALDTTILLATVPDALRGRMTSVHMTTYMGVSRLSLVILGGLLAAFDVRAVGVVSGCASVLVAVPWWLTQRGIMRQHYVEAVSTA
ncbi:MAG: MFS transporter [Kutzneria sp.]|nr:MFS transporter [Kutzneria sp.]